MHKDKTKIDRANKSFETECEQSFSPVQIGPGTKVW